MEAKLQKKFTHVSLDVIRHLLKICAGDQVLVQENLRAMSVEDIRRLEASLRESAARPLTPRKRQKVAEFKAISASRSEKTAITLLSQNGWELESALNAFFSCDMGDDDEDEPPTFEPTELVALFDKYKAIGIEEGAPEGTNNMEGAALHAFAKDMNADDEDGYCLYVAAFLVRAHTPLTFTRDEFVNGLMGMGIRNLQDIKQKISTWNPRQTGTFKDFYRFCYDWTKPNPMAKVLDNETACDLWTMFFTDRYPLLERWIDYVKNHFKKAITKDVWYQFLDFSTLQADLSDYDFDGAWPMLFDEFVEHAKASFVAK